MEEKMHVFCVPHLRQVASVFQETCCPGIVEEKEAKKGIIGVVGVLVFCP